MGLVGRCSWRVASSLRRTPRAALPAFPAEPAFPVLLIFALTLIVAGCARAAAVHVGVVFGDNWALGPIVLTHPEIAVIKREALETLRRAYDGYQVTFTEEATADRLIAIDRHLMRSGATPIGSRVSTVSLDGVYMTLLTVTRCRDLASCDEPGRGDRTREAMVAALGRGLGATAAHELAHQAGLAFGRDSGCDECYDAGSASNLAHFFGTKRWSPEAIAIMKHVLPAADTIASPGSSRQTH